MRNRSRRTLSIVTAMTALASIAVGCGGPGGDPGDAVVASPADVETARAVYDNESCGMCHGPAGEGTDLAPALEDLAGYWDEDRLVRYLEDPVAFQDADPSFGARRDIVYDMEMPSYGHVPEPDRRSLARWLLTR